jgi:hypothetical protein
VVEADGVAVDGRYGVGGAEAVLWVAAPVDEGELPVVWPADPVGVDVVPEAVVVPVVPVVPVAVPVVPVFVVVVESPEPSAPAGVVVSPVVGSVPSPSAGASVPPVCDVSTGALVSTATASALPAPAPPVVAGSTFAGFVGFVAAGAVVSATAMWCTGTAPEEMNCAGAAGATAPP